MTTLWVSTAVESICSRWVCQGACLELSLERVGREEEVELLGRCAPLSPQLALQPLDDDGRVLDHVTAHTRDGHLAIVGRELDLRLPPQHARPQHARQHGSDQHQSRKGASRTRRCMS